MKYLLTVTLLGILIAGCAPRPRPSEAGKEVPRDNPNIANVAPEGRSTEAAPTETTSSLPAMTANPTAIPLTPIQGNTPVSSSATPVSSGDWQTFISTALGVSVNYPSDWSAVEGADGVTFTSPKGVMVQLKQSMADPKSNEFKIANQYCTSRTNEHGQTADICVDNASFTYTANFSLQQADGSTQRVVLMTKTRAVGNVFEAMFNSLQPTK